jgi:nitrogen regulatory protein PII
MSNIVFHDLKKIEIIVHGDKKAFLKDLLDQAGATGYTMIRDVAGMGHSGFHEGRLLFNDNKSLIMFMTVAEQDTIEKIIAGLTPLFEKNSGVMFVSDTSVVRLEKFVQDDDYINETAS